MKVCAIICEYNPFHNGHAHQMQEARRLSGCDYLICVMSGNFVQRGEPAILDKWMRASFALSMGADLVLELPSLFSLRAAPDFALGAVTLLHSLQSVTHLSFGSEIDDLDTLWAFAQEETPEESRRIRLGLEKGHSYQKAVAMANGDALAANALLGTEYMRALRRLSAATNIVPVLRTRQEGGALDSSSAIRRALFKGDEAAALCACPKPLQSALQAALQGQGGPLQAKAFEPMLLYRLRRMSPAEIAQYPYVSEGLENRIHEAARKSGSLEELLAAIQTRRYSAARIRRALMHLLLGNTRAFLDAHPKPSYARVLGFQKSAEPLLRHLSQSTSIPLITKTAVLRDDPLFLSEAAATDLWVLGLSNAQMRKAGQDFTTSPVML